MSGNPVKTGSRPARTQYLREHHEAETVDEPALQQAPHQRQAADDAQRIAPLVLECRQRVIRCEQPGLLPRHRFTQRA